MKDRQHNGQKGKQRLTKHCKSKAVNWRTDNIMAKRKYLRTKGHTVQWSKENGQQNRQYNGLIRQKDKQWSTKHYTEN